MLIPGFSKYDVTESGVVTLVSTREPVDIKLSRKWSTRGCPLVQIRTDTYKNRWMLVARCVLMAHRPLEDDEKYPWTSVRYLDEDVGNVNLSNLRWDHEWYQPRLLPGYNCPMDIPVPIYGLPGFKITVDGIVSNNRTGTRYRAQMSPDGRPMLSIPDAYTSQLARFLALTFLPHPKDTYMLVVNHKDGDVLNSQISNLEWATYRENLEHAYETNLRAECDVVLAKHMDSGKIETFKSLNEAARFFSVNPGAMHYQLHDRQSSGYKGYLLKYASDKRSWDEIANKPRNTEVVGVRVLRISDRKEFKLHSKMATVRFTTIPMTSLTRLLASDTPEPHKGYMVAPDRGTAIRWPVYPDEIVSLFGRMRNTARPFKTTGPDGIHFYAGVTEWVDHHPGEIDPAVLSRKLQHTNRHKDWVFEYINPLDYAYPETTPG